MTTSSTAARDLDLVVVGGANTDFLVKGAELPRAGTTVQGETFQEAAGGKGANQAVAAARLGARVAFVARVGADDRGTRLIERLAGEGVDTSHVKRHPRAASGVALVMVDAGGEKQIMTAPGANRELTVADVQAAAPWIARARVLLVQLEVPLATVEAALRLARSAGAHTVLDPAPPRPLSSEMLRDVHVIRPNAAEAEALTGVEVKDEASARKAAENLIERGAGAAVVAAPGGNLLLSSEVELWVPHIPVRAVDATGAGDAFAAAFAVALAEDHSLSSAARFAGAAAALKTTKLGAQAGLPTRDEVLALLSA